MHLFNPSNPNCGSVLWEARDDTRIIPMDQVTLPAMLRVFVAAGHPMLSLFPNAAGWHYLARVYVNGVERHRPGDLLNSWDYIDVSRPSTRVHTLYWWDSFASLDSYQQAGLMQSLRFVTSIGDTEFDSAGPVLTRAELLSNIESVANPVTIRGEFTGGFRYFYLNSIGETIIHEIQFGAIWFEVPNESLVIGQKFRIVGVAYPLRDDTEVQEVVATQGWLGHFTLTWLATSGVINVRTRPELRFAQWAAFSLKNPPHIDIMYPFPVVGQVLVGQEDDVIYGEDLGELEVQPYWV